MRNLVLFAAAFAGLACASSRAEVALPALFSEHMVLQRSARTAVWGRADPGERVVVELGAAARATATAAADGRWRAALDLSDPGRAPAGPHVLRIQGKNTVEIPDVLVGEVWLASGQSNMARTMKVCGSAEEIAASANDRVRFFTVENRALTRPAEDVAGRWVKAAPETTPAFSAVAYYFARRIEAGLGGPVGVVHASWGGTAIEAWTSVEALRRDPETAKATEFKAREAQRNPAEGFAGRKAAWLATLRPWLAAQGRDDTPTSPEALADFVTGPTTGWEQARLPGELRGDRVFWLRREVRVPALGGGGEQEVVVTLDGLGGLETVYLGGKRLGGRGWEAFGGFGHDRLDTRRYYRARLAPGVYPLAIRIYAPFAESGVTGSHFSFGQEKLAGLWAVKTERAFPALSSAALAARPERLVAPQRPQMVPGSLYNGMIAGLAPYGLRGVLWYQGEGDAGRAERYRRAFPLMIEDWRSRWANGESAEPLSFYWCQLPNYQAKTADPGAPAAWAELREAQTLALRLPRTGQAVLIDAGEAGDIHPKDKHLPGERLAALALANDYAGGGEFSGPVFDSMTLEGASARIRFRHVGGGLVARAVPTEYLHASTPTRVTRPLRRNRPGSELEGFALRGAGETTWRWADARIDGDSVVVSSPEVARPQAVRYAWAANPTCNLYNAAGFPAAPFRTDAE